MKWNAQRRKGRNELEPNWKPKKYQMKQKVQRQKPKPKTEIKREWSDKDSRKLLLMRLKVLMLSQNLRGNGVEFLIGKASQSIQVN